MRKAVHVALLACLVLCPVRTALAQGAEITGFAGYEFWGSVTSAGTERPLSIGNAVSFGGAMDIPIDKSFRVELYFSRQNTHLHGADPLPPVHDLRVDYYHLGILEEKGTGPATAIGAFLLGATRFEPQLPGFSGKTVFSIAFMLGAKYALSEHVALRAEARALGTFVEANGALFCGPSGCLLAFGGSNLWQGALNAGLAIRF
jgi:hypothetical protein